MANDTRGSSTSEIVKILGNYRIVRKNSISGDKNYSTLILEIQHRNSLGEMYYADAINDPELKGYSRLDHTSSQADFIFVNTIMNTLYSLLEAIVK